MIQIKVTELRAHLPEFLKKVRSGEEIQITSHGRPIARLIPDSSNIERAKKRLEQLKGTVIVKDIIEPVETEWSSDADNL